ncbi:MAG: cysteine desulfurase [Lachnospiraceae bacterium]|nr:cysteine desulfurase [Lachnospiraceae bacterium]
MIYLDNAATTPVEPEVIQAMLPYFTERFGNASGIYEIASVSKTAIRNARQKCAQLMGAQPEEIFFTSGGTESDNWAVFEGAHAAGEKRHLLTSAVEHQAVLQSFRALEREGYEVEYLPVDGEGFCLPETVEAAIRPDTGLISIMTANNEIGTLQRIAQIGGIAKKHGILFHTDAVQAYGQIPLDTEELQADLLSASAHKLGGPKGVGLLYVRKGVPLGSRQKGGGQERARRAGTENVPGIVGFGEAARIAGERMRERQERVSGLRDLLLGLLTDKIPNVLLNGPAACGGERLPGNLNLTIPGIEGESLLILLDGQGICASSGSACSTGAAEPSHVLTAIGRSPEQAKASLRLTLSHRNTEEEIREASEGIAAAVSRLRSLRES